MYNKIPSIAIVNAPSLLHVYKQNESTVTDFRQPRLVSQPGSLYCWRYIHTHTGTQKCRVLFVVVGKINWQQSDIELWTIGRATCKTCRKRERKHNIDNGQKATETTQWEREREKKSAQAVRVRLTISDNYEYNIKITQYYKGIKKHTEWKIIKRIAEIVQCSTMHFSVFLFSFSSIQMM